MKPPQTMAGLVLLALLAATLAPAALAQADGRPLVRGIVGQFPTTPINPLLQPSIPRANQLLFESLVSYGADLKPRGQLAERWEISGDGLTFTFTLRRNVKWHDGRPFTADDVVYTAQTAIDERSRSRLRPYYRVARQSVRVEKVDTYTVRFHLPAPAADFLYNLSQWNLMVPRHHLEGRDLTTADFNSRPVGTGPFRFVQLREHQSIRMVANPSYHLGRPRINLWVDRGFEDQMAGLAALAREEVDVLALESRHAVEIARRLPNTRIVGYNPGWIYALNLNLKAGFFGDLQVRQALSYALDRESLAKIAGDAPVAWSLIGPPASWLHNPNIPKYPKDVERARQLLRAAGFQPGPGGVMQKDGAPFRFTLWIESDAAEVDTDALATALQHAFRAIGVEMLIERHDKRSLERLVFLGRQFDAFLWWNGYNFDPDPSLYWHSKTSVNNYDDPAVDRLIDQAAGAANPEARKQLLDAIALKVAKDAAFIPLYYYSRYVAVRNTLKTPPASVADFASSGVVYDVHTIERTK